MIRVNFIKSLAEKEARDSRRYLVMEIAEQVGVSRQTINLWMSGRLHTVNLDTLDKVCAFLGCTPGDLLEYVPDLTPPA